MYNILFLFLFSLQLKHFESIIEGCHILVADYEA